MKHTVIALFDQAEHAQQAAQALQSRGFDAAAVQVAPGSGPDDAEVVPPAARIESGPLTGLLHRLSVLFTVEEPHLSQYEEAVRRGASVVQVDTADEAQAAAARDTLVAMGALDIDDRVAQWQGAGWRSPAAGAPESASTPAAPGAGGVAHRQEISSGGVRVYRSVSVVAFEDLAGDFRADYEAQYAVQGTTYDDFDPAYRYGHALAADTRYDGRSWAEMEPHARAEWESRHPQSAWERFSGAVRHAWERATRR